MLNGTPHPNQNATHEKARIQAQSTKKKFITLA
jgi:hypothetical protein